jgi:transcriptional regulator with XRE-family HTH domain
LQAGDERDLIAEAMRHYAEELTRWREHRNLSKGGLATLMTYDRSYVSQIEGCHLPPTEDFTRRAEAVLDTGGALWQRWTAYEHAKGRAARPQPRRPPTVSLSAGFEERPGELTVEHDDAVLRYDGSRYHLKMSRSLYNATDAAITRYLVKVSADRYPDEPERSKQHYRHNPLTFQELGFTAWCGDEPMATQPKLDRDAFKELWLLLENDQAKFPLYPGERTWIHYRYTIGDDKWGRWFQRAVRLPTRRLSVRLAFPTHLEPTVWGTEISYTAGQLPLRAPLQRSELDDLTVFDWATQHPPLNIRYRFEWRFRAPEAAG